MQSDKNTKSISIHRISSEGHAPSKALFFDLAIFRNFFHVEFQKDDLRAVLRDDLSIRTQDVNSPDMRFRSRNGDHASQLPIVPLQRLVDDDDGVIDSQVSLSLCPLLSRVKERQVFTTPRFPEGVDASLRLAPSRSTSGRVVARMRSRDGRRRVAERRGIEDVSGSERL